MAPPSLVRLRRSSFGYHGSSVVSEVDLDVEPGAFVGIVGPNGSGKTTLFRGILGLVEPLEGSVERATASVGYVPQREQLDAAYPLTVEEVVRMGAHARLTRWGRLRREDRDEALRHLEAVDLADRRGRLFASLSGGERQRALIARALLMRPELLLLDEPTSGVDSRAQRLVFDLLGRLNRERGLAILLVSHELSRLRSSAREVLMVAGGRVERGPAEELLRPERLELVFGAEGR